MTDFNVSLPTGARIPIVLSIPHCGTAFPDELRNEYDPRLIQEADDTDWYVDRLYSFAPALGITVISAVWSRWVIDLNRNPDSRPLYSDGRIITNLCPLTTFLGEPLYKDRRKSLFEAEIERRKQRFFEPYHTRLKELLREVKLQFGYVLLWDCHSIRQRVKTIQAEKFPDLILGSADAVSADGRLIETALRALGRAEYSVSHNHPFKGGYITRHYGNPERHEHALQLEMSKINYMDDAETGYHPERAKKMEELLYNAFSSLLKTLISLKD